ncbi:hypothetical protein NDU88_001661 [Pleurodeles waltl]|uniref:Uncharacterized protein n=1 Tax=Pleurodeles waltl TaxID=8319 RepID=A0AAV7VCC9_PLEWA|nr:hypothetical protein NDU88_001661 [Pleurodeles waltl]
MRRWVTERSEPVENAKKKTPETEGPARGGATRGDSHPATFLEKHGLCRWGRGLAAIHDGRLRAELRMAAALEALQGTPERSGGHHRSWRRRTADICDVGGAPSPEAMGDAREAGLRPTAGF